ncbi:hypothetical protein [Streptomyces lydicus]|uniref:hypothetical protein n=1 Tax=Streptomyces lydicus TaxID=47763 RepID=UPI00379F44D2
MAVDVGSMLRDCQPEGLKPVYGLVALGSRREALCRSQLFGDPGVNEVLSEELPTEVGVTGGEVRSLAGGGHWMPWVVVTGAALSITGVIFTVMAGVPLSDSPDVRVLWRIALTFR